MLTGELRQHQVLGGLYRIERKVDAGARGELWLAQDLEIPRQVAVKVRNSDPRDLPSGVIHPEQRHDLDQAHARFVREAQTAGALQPTLGQPTVTVYFSAGEAPGSSGRRWR